MMTIILKARCRLFEANFRIIRSQFDIEPNKELFGEYVVMNLMREHGVLEDGRLYQITIEPLKR